MVVNTLSTATNRERVVMSGREESPSVKMQHSAKTEMGPSGTITMQRLREFVPKTEQVPASAEVGAIMGDKGTQRDPWPFLRGLTVKWES